LGKRRVVVIEPNPDMQSKIEKIFQLNGFQNYRIFQCACSDKKGEFYFYIDEKDHSTSRISSDPTDLKVQLLPLDTILEGVDKPVSFIKIDVEGHEAEVMMGGQRTLRVHRPIMVFETGTHTSEQLRNINYILTEMSYEVVGVLQEWGIERKTLSLQMTNRSHCNVLAIPKHHL
jgi:FkbM family methyltransferase